MPKESADLTTRLRDAWNDLDRVPERVGLRVCASGVGPIPSSLIADARTQEIAFVRSARGTAANDEGADHDGRGRGNHDPEQHPSFEQPDRGHG